jgi:hypothetical protein
MSYEQLSVAQHDSDQLQPIKTLLPTIASNQLITVNLLNIH